MKVENLKREVTIPLDEYEEMKNTIRRLTKENEEKTIYKKDYVGSVVIGVSLGMLIFLFFTLP